MVSVLFHVTVFQLPSLFFNHRSIVHIISMWNIYLFIFEE